MKPDPYVSLKPFVLMFDEYYTDLYRMSEAEEWINDARHFVFMGRSFSVNITETALGAALSNQANIEVISQTNRFRL